MTDPRNEPPPAAGDCGRADGAAADGSSEFWDALRKGLLIGAGILVLVVPPIKIMQHRQAQQQPAVVATAPPSANPQVAQAPQHRAPKAEVDAASPGDGAPAVPDLPPLAQGPDTSTLPGAEPSPAAPPAKLPPGVRLADFGSQVPSVDVRHVANWAVATHDHGKRAFVVIDKKNARVWLFGPDGRLRQSTPALLGQAIGDITYPGVGDKPLSQVKLHEKTTPAGRFIAEPGRNLSGEDIIWVDYDAAVSMHRVRPLVKAERRLERLASETAADNRISFGCINLPVVFYEKHLSPTVQKSGAVVYVLPERRTPQQVFGSYDVTQGLQATKGKAARAA